jgi:hypothetical protein
MDQDLHGPQLSRVLPGRFPEPKPFLEALWTYYLYLNRKPQNLEIVFGEPHVQKKKASLHDSNLNFMKHVMKLWFLHSATHKALYICHGVVVSPFLDVELHCMCNGVLGQVIHFLHAAHTFLVFEMSLKATIFPFCPLLVFCQVSLSTSCAFTNGHRFSLDLMHKL